MRFFLAVILISISSPVCSLVLGLNIFRFLGETTQLPLMAPSNDKANQPAAAGQGEVILSDVIGRDKSINIFSGFTRDVACIETRLDDFKVNTTVLAPLNSAIEKLPRKPWEDPRDYGAFGADAYEGEDGIDRAQRNLRRFVESHIVPRSPWAENDKVQAVGGGRNIWWESEGGKKVVRSRRAACTIIEPRAPNCLGRSSRTILKLPMWQALYPMEKWSVMPLLTFEKAFRISAKEYPLNTDEHVVDYQGGDQLCVNDNLSR